MVGGESSRVGFRSLGSEFDIVYRKSSERAQSSFTVGKREGERAKRERREGAVGGVGIREVWSDRRGEGGSVR